MKLVIDIPENLYNFVNTKRPNGYYNEFDKFDTYDVSKCIREGKPLPKGHGDLIDRDHMIARLETASKFFGGEHTDAFDERFSQGLKEAVIKVAEEPTVVEADKGEQKC